MQYFEIFKRGLIITITTIILLITATAVHAQGDAEDGKIKARACQVCHGQGGNSKNSTYPRLAGQHAKYIVKQLKAFKAGTRKDPIMNGMASDLSVQDMEDVAAYFESNGD